ncbi:MAG: hypothetical protein A4S08_11810 [Proteobacteria bacterium SG_bin4]|nr:MAG: hypothetical protein A4S08_11810 [Proteobacteria bacterium SG_bin4]
MHTIDKSIEYVNQQLTFYQSRIADSKTRNVKFFEHHFEATQSVKAHLEHLKQVSSAIDNEGSSSGKNDYVSITPNDIQGLPQELINELGLTESDHNEFEIVNIIKQHGGTMSLDHILIALYKKTGTVHKRKILTAKLYRMVNKGLVFTDKRGIYSVSPVNNDRELPSNGELTSDE